MCTTNSIAGEQEEEPLSAQQIKENQSENEEDDATQASPTKATNTKKKATTNQKLILCTHATRYNVIKRVCRKMEYKLNEDVNADWDLYWSDVGV